MSSVLTVKSPFLGYVIGNQITDPTTITAILANPDYAGLVIQSGTASSGSGSGGGGGSGSSGPVTLVANNGVVTVDNSTIAITSGNVLHVIPSTTGSINIISTLGYTPANAALIGANSGIATLDSTGKVPNIELPANVSTAMSFVGTWDALANNPPLLGGSGTKGAVYKVSVAGNAPLDGFTAWNVGDYLSFNGTTWDKIGGSTAPAVTNFNTRTGAITLNNIDVQTALGFTPYNSANPLKFITGSQVAGFSPVASFNGRTGAITLNNSDVTASIGYTPYSATNPSGFVNAVQAANASPIKSFNTRTGDISLTSSDVTTALTYTPYPSTNPNNYVTPAQLAVANVVSVAGRQGNVVLTASDVGGLARVGVTGSYSDLTARPVIPSATSQLTNDSGFITAASAGVTSINSKTGAVTLSTADLANTAGFVTATTAPVVSIDGMQGAVTLPQQTGTMMALAVSSLTNDLNYISTSGLATLDISSCLVTVNNVTQTIAIWLSQNFLGHGHILNDTSGLWYLEDGSILSF